GADTIAWHLEHDHGVRRHPATIHRILVPAGLGLPADASTTSASDEPTPEPTSSCSSTAHTSASCTPPPANFSATSPSTPAATTNPPEGHQDPHPHPNEGSTVRHVSRDHNCGTSALPFEPFGRAAVVTRRTSRGSSPARWGRNRARYEPLIRR